MINYQQDGDVLTLTPGANVAAGVGYLFGTSLFGVAVADVASGSPGAFITDGVVEIAKTDSLAIAVGDRVFWDATNKCVNKTTTSQQCVGICVEAVAVTAGIVKVKIKLGCYTAVAA
jgi:predicted RecA/RadA family phage recombinase